MLLLTTLLILWMKFIQGTVLFTEEEIAELSINIIAKKLRQGQINDNDTMCFATTHWFKEKLLVLDKDVNSLAYMNPEAEEQAVMVDQMERKGKLNCVPIVVADNIPIHGMPMSLGLEIFSTQSIEFDSGPLIKSLISGGAVVLGKTNVSPLGLPSLMDDAQYKGLVNNPYNAISRVGYNNAGVAAAIAARMAVIGIGSDSTGDGLVCAADSNIVAVRPPADVFSFETLFPTIVYQDAIVLYALSLTDIATVIDVATHQTLPYYRLFETEQAKIISWSVLSNLTWDKHLNLTLPSHNMTWKIDHTVRDMMKMVVKSLAKEDILVKNTTHDIMSTLAAVMPYQNQISACFSDWMSSYWSGRLMKSPEGPIRSFDALTKEIMLSNVSQKSLELLHSLRKNCSRAIANLLGARQNLRAAFDPIFQDTDILLMPATVNGHLQEEMHPNATLFGSHYPGAALPAMLGYPAVTLPIAFRSERLGFIWADEEASPGIPVGMIMMSTPENFKFLLQAAQFYQTVITPKLRTMGPDMLHQATYSTIIASGGAKPQAPYLVTFLSLIIIYYLRFMSIL